MTERFFKNFPVFDAALKGISQIFLQENRWTGILFLLALFTGHWKYGAAAFLGAILGTLAAQIFGYEKHKIDSGLYGFNSALIALALVVIFKDAILIWLLMPVAALLSVLFFQGLSLIRIPAYTFPFIALTWIFYWLIDLFMLIPSSEIVQSNLPEFLQNTSIFPGFITGLGQVVFQQGIWAGLLILAGLWINSTKAAQFGFLGALIGAVTAFAYSGYVGISTENISLGIFGFNAVLTGIALSGDQKNDNWWALAGIVITVILHILMIDSGWWQPLGGVFTFPFVVGTWLILIVKKLFVSPHI